jgi:hypothetical protein
MEVGKSRRAACLVVAATTAVTGRGAAGAPAAASAPDLLPMGAAGADGSAT